MLKLIGALVTLAVPAWAGFQIAARYRRRPNELRALQNGLSVLVTEVEYGATPLPAALRSAARSAGGTVGPLFEETAYRLEAGGGKTAGDALAEALHAVAPRAALSAGDWDVIQALVGVLGASGRHDQVRHLRLALERLVGAEAEANDERARYERMYQYVGVLSGLALVLILI